MGRSKELNCTVQISGLEEDFNCKIDKSSKGESLFNRVCSYIGIAEKEYFGLRYIDEKDGQFNWLDNDRNIKKQMRKAPLHFYFAVKFYPDNPTTLREDITRYHFVLQLREDLLKGRIQCSNPIHALLASYIMQAEVGDLIPGEHEEAYLRDLKFFPKQPPEIKYKIESFHQKHVGMSPADAEFQYLDNVRKLPLYGRDIHQSWGADGQPVTVGVSAWGVEVFSNNRLMHKFVWPKIITISFKTKRFSLTLRASSEDDYYKSTTICFKLGSQRAAKRLWKVCVEHHSFFRLKEPAPIPASTSILRVGSKFRYSGRTQHQARCSDDVGSREQPSFDRVTSKRFSTKILDSNRRSMLVEDESKKDKVAKSPTHAEEKKDPEKEVKEEQKDEPTVEAPKDPEPEPEPQAVEAAHVSSSEALVEQHGVEGDAR